MRDIPHFIDGAAVAGTSGRWSEVFNPNTGEVQARTPLANESEIDRAVQSALRAQQNWALVNPQRRARVMFEFKRLVEARMDELAELLSSEHGKVLADSRGDVQRGLEVIEFACGIPHALKGEYTEGAGPGIDVYSMRQPLGVAAGITPFNFPAMIPMWMFGIAIAVGNAFVLKPSEKDPSVPVRLAELMMEAGAPSGILNVVHGDKVAVDALLDHPDVKAVSFVGSSDIAQYVYSRGTAHGKRVQAMGGAKNHGVVMPDADLDQATRDIIGAAYGSAGERCMALPVVVPVGAKTAEALRERVLAEIETLKVGVSTDAAAQYGPVVTAAHRQRIADYIQLGVDEGAELVVDGRAFRLQGYENGFFIGPTLFDRVTPQMRTYREEIFGPVLQMVRAKDFEEAVRLPSSHEYGNGVAIFTRNGHAAREFTARVNVGMVGVNVPIPVPVSYHSFGGWKRSGFGDIGQYGQEGMRFWTKTKVVTQRWPDGSADAGDKSAFHIPTFG
jgi:malonate-semialdehyde dehydrogenase (acetylating)/methylmalonate-semialdehyde dehydrogenase